MLIAAMVGIDTRSTMDMDATIKGVSVSKETIKGIFDEILDVNINQKLLAYALNETVKKRGTTALFDNKDLIVSEIITSSTMQDLWTRYQKKYDYAGDVSWSDVMSTVEATLNISGGR